MTFDFLKEIGHTNPLTTNFCIIVHQEFNLIS